MNTAVVSALIAKLTAGCGLVLLLPLLTALFGEEPVLPFIYSMALCFLLSAFLRYKGKKKVINLNPRDGLAVTALSWICISILYLFPYFLSGLLSPLDALVESISGLTGTGATVFSDLTVLPKSILFFRSLTHWLGGLGIIVIFVALFPQAGKGSARMIDAESTGPYSSRAVPRIKEMAKALFAVYLLFTVSAALIYTLLGMNFFDAVNHAFSTIATGGFSTKNESIAFYDSTPLKLAVIFFMVISSANFGIYVAAWKRGIRVLWENTEFKVYLSIVAAATILISLNLMLESGLYAPSALLEALFTSAAHTHVHRRLRRIDFGRPESNAHHIAFQIHDRRSPPETPSPGRHTDPCRRRKLLRIHAPRGFLFLLHLYDVHFFMDRPYRRKRCGYSFCPGPFHCHHEQLGAGTGTIRRHLQLVGHACHDKNGRRPVHAYGPA